MHRVVPIAVLMSFVAVSAEAVTAREILDLSRAGLGEEVLLALIEMDGGVFTLDTATLTSLKQAGVSERVILAMVRSGRARAVEAPEGSPVAMVPPDPPQPQVIVIEHETPVIQQIAVPVPVYVPVFPLHTRYRRARHPSQLPIDTSPGFGAPLPSTDRMAEPLYWGWGGKLRPDAWKPDSEHPRK